MARRPLRPCPFLPYLVVQKLIHLFQSALVTPLVENMTPNTVSHSYPFRYGKAVSRLCLARYHSLVMRGNAPLKATVMSIQVGKLFPGNISRQPGMTLDSETSQCPVLIHKSGCSRFPRDTRLDEPSQLSWICLGI